MLYREAIHKSIKGRSIEAITSAIIYIVCRQYGVPRTLEEIKQVSWENKERKIYKAVNYLTQKLELKIPPASPRDFVFRFCSWLDLSIKTRAEVWEMANRDFNGRTPTGIAAAAIYIITESAESNNEHRTKKKIAEITGVSIPTILKGTKEVSKQLENIPN